MLQCALRHDQANIIEGSLSLGVDIDDNGSQTETVINPESLSKKGRKDQQTSEKPGKERQLRTINDYKEKQPSTSSLPKQKPDPPRRTSSLQRVIPPNHHYKKKDHP